ncbi:MULTISPECIES: asparaginase [unclassified Caballeronia]|uniref:asparaginase n=1 Tax=unclassified Caballeronia TaxID=2646786 RepID=UPI002028ECE6|nr:MULTISPECIES: asparaginase [unclassified Caballeronia]
MRQTPVSPDLRRIVVMGLGGTIAASAPSATQTHGYELTGAIADVLKQVSQLADIADVRFQQVANVSSQDIDNAMLSRLLHAVNAQLADASVDGIVISHGTDTLEETAYFLHLLVKGDKPVILTGAMRPSSALSADGPLNLFHAVRVATDHAASGKGVLVVIDERIVSAKGAVKLHTSATSAFSNPAIGLLGSVSGGTPAFHAVVPTTAASEFDLPRDLPDSLPQVDIVYGHQSAGVHFYRAAIDAGARGIVFAGTGNGSLSHAAKAGALMAREHGVAFVRSSRVPGGGVAPCADDEDYATIAAHTLNPQKARVLLMLALARHMDTQALRRCFALHG